MEFVELFGLKNNSELLGWLIRHKKYVVCAVAHLPNNEKVFLKMGYGFKELEDFVRKTFPVPMEEKRVIFHISNGDYVTNQIEEYCPNPLWEYVAVPKIPVECL